MGIENRDQYNQYGNRTTKKISKGKRIPRVSSKKVNIKNKNILVTPSTTDEFGTFVQCLHDAEQIKSMKKVIKNNPAEGQKNGREMIKTYPVNNDNKSMKNSKIIKLGVKKENRSTM